MKGTRSIAIILSGMLAGSAQAHAGFILPDAFHAPACGPIGAVASFSDAFPAPEVALRSDTFAIITPAGERRTFDSVQSDHAMTRLVTQAEAPGTYRLTSGVRHGRTGRAVQTADGYLRLEDGEDPESLEASNAALLTTRAVTVSEVSITCGARPEQTRQQTDGRLAIRPMSEHLAGISQVFEIRFGDAAAPIDEIRLVPAYRAETDSLADKLNARGRIDLGSLTPGPYTLLVRHIAPAPEEAGVDLYSYSTTLTFEIRPATLQAD